MKTDWTSLSDGEIWDRIAGNLSPAEYHGDDTDLTLSPASVLEMWGNDPDVTEADATIISEALRRHVRGAAHPTRGERGRKMIAQIFTHNAFHNCDSESVEVEGYLGQLGHFVVDPDIFLAVGDTCHNAECLCGPWCSLRAQLPDGRIVPVAA